MTVRERDFVAGPDGLRLRLREHGEPSAPPLVILHGWLEQAAAWDEVAARLPRRHVVAPDLRGHGLSDHVGKGSTYHFWDYVADVDALVDHLGEPVDLVGHSMGGTLAALVAGVVPEKIRKLVLIEGLGPPDGEPSAVTQARTALVHRREPPVHKPVRDHDDGARRLRKANPDLSEEAALRLATRVMRPEGDGYTWTWDVRHRTRAPQAFLLRQFLLFLAEIRAPTLLIEGRRSPYQGIPDLALRRSSISGARTTTLDAGHNPHHTCPDALAACIEEHLLA